MGRIPNEIKPLLDVWRSGQMKLPWVTRWSRFSHTKLRRQDSLQHSYALTVLMTYVVNRLRPYVELNGELLIVAALIHDHGEAETGVDVPRPQKKEEHDLAEYLTFRQRYASLGFSYEYFDQAFLLQFITDKTDVFPQDARETMDILREHFMLEGQLFKAMEYYDYLLYALEQLAMHDNTELAIPVIRNCIPVLCQAAVYIPGFTKEIWTDEMAKWCVALTS